MYPAVVGDSVVGEIEGPEVVGDDVGNEEGS